ncbi:hypothetical protein ARZXY2_4482 (plasmid) [Arthrobacter sp. ZXY-2]|nr:hypothetical protein ARZXY2_4482 [Arthrobacter sp. ZXY-2]
MLARASGGRDEVQASGTWIWQDDTTECSTAWGGAFLL